MPLNTDELARVANAAIDLYARNEAVDQITIEKPILTALKKGMKKFSGGQQFYVEQIRKGNDSNGQTYQGNANVTYNKRDPLAQAKWKWGNWHEGFTLNEDELAHAGIVITDERSGGVSKATKAELIQLSNLFDENIKSLRLGVEESLSKALVLGTSWTAPGGFIAPGLDDLVSTTPNSGTVGGIDAAANSYWRNYAQTGLGVTLSVLLDALELAYRSCRRRGGKPSAIWCGYSFYDALRNAVLAANVTAVQYKGGEGVTVDMSTKALMFRGIEIQWIPEFDDDFGGAVSPVIPYRKRCYIIDESSLTLRPLENNWMKMRTPGRAHDAYVYYYAMTSSWMMTCNRRNANAVISIA